ncbi:MAG: serine/threonine protein kinase [Deltaproteobacteria bacterium]|nr:serine/threonine protein kinase [Deltaproteobacteria bacterium]
MTKMDDISKAIFGRYLLLKRIGKGGMGEVFRAMSFGASGFKKFVAIKRILPVYSDDPNLVSMFINEASIVSHLNHSNIVQINDFGRVDERLYAAMDYIHGVSLMDLLSTMSKAKIAPPIEAACYIIREALYGLEQAHQQQDARGEPLNIIHRDISPANILLSFDGEVKITDFSIAKAANSEVETADGVLKGKLRYMSPEQARGEPLDRRSDIFSLGACFYELLTLRRLYPSGATFKVADLVRKGDFLRPQDHNPEVPKALEAISRKALKPVRTKRYADASAWRKDLEDFITKGQIGFYRANLTALLQELFKDLMLTKQAEMREEMDYVTKMDFVPMQGADNPPSQGPSVNVPSLARATDDSTKSIPGFYEPQKTVEHMALIEDLSLEEDIITLDGLKSLESDTTDESDTPEMDQQDTVVNVPTPKLPPRRKKKR